MIVTDDYEFPPSASATPPPAARSVPGSSSAADGDGMSRAGAAAAAVYNSTMGVSADKSPSVLIRDTEGRAARIQQGEVNDHLIYDRTQQASVSDKGEGCNAPT